MARITYYFDTELSQYRRVETQWFDKGVTILGISLIAMLAATISLLAFPSFLKSPREFELSNEVKEMEFYYAELNKKVESYEVVLSSIEQRDDNIYRVIMGAEPVDPGLRHGESNSRGSLLSPINSISDLDRRIGKLRRKMYVESLSQDELMQLTINKERLYAAIPAIQPISNKLLIAIASGFGLRIHPIYKVIRMHYGIDFAAPTGTIIHATADGQVVAINENFDSHGKMVTIDHGFGYTTRYGHMQDFLVKIGQQIKRGEQIGYVGNTGLSTAPHLHYEILINGEQIDPVHYFFNDLTPEEYEKVAMLASIKNQSLGN